MPTDDEYQALLHQYNRLRRAAIEVVNAVDLEDPEARVYAHQLEDLRRELAGIPQPHSKLSWMSVT